MPVTTIPKQSQFRKNIAGRYVDLVILKNSNNVQAAITNYGARWVSLLMPDKENILHDVLVGPDSIDGYLASSEPFYGATVGRCANRIRNGKFALEGAQHQLTQNKGTDHLHGGNNGFHTAVWTFEKVSECEVTLSYLSKHGEEGYPGNLQVRVSYSLTNNNELQIRFWAQTDKPTIINLTNHAFFNLNGLADGTALGHMLYINADHYTPMDATSIPTGAVAAVSGTPFDFRQPTVIGARIEAADIQLKNGNGYDHNFILNKSGNAMNPQLAATAIGDKTGICMDVYTTAPGLQLYTGNYMDGTNTVKNGLKDNRRTAFCLETQYFPDAPNHPDFPSIALYPGETYNSISVFTFSIAG